MIVSRMVISLRLKRFVKNESLITTILSEGLERISDENYDQKEVTDAIEEAGNEQMIIYMKSINYLSIIGGTAPMLGLLERFPE